MAETNSAHNGREKAVLFIHGFMGSPKQFEYLYPVAKAHGFAPHALLLPGHGCSLDEFYKTHAKAWQAHVHKELNALRKTYSDILLVGHSMGGLLAISQAAAEGEGIRGILALALPLYLKVSKKGVYTNICYIKKRLKKADKYVDAAKEASGVDGVTLLNSIKLLPRVIELTRICALARNDLKRIELPLTLVHSKNDEWVSKRSVLYASRLAQTCPKIVELPESGHFWYSDADREVIKSELIALMQ